MAGRTPHRPRRPVALLAGLVLAVASVSALAPRAAAEKFTAPELFIARADPGTSSRGTNPWIALGGAQIHSAGSYRLGVRVQPTSDTLDREYLTASWTLPRGHPVGTAGGPCARVQGTPGAIADWGGLEYGGTGTYRLRAAMTAYVSGPCPTTGGPPSDDTLTVDPRSIVHVVGAPRAHDRGRHGFRGVRATDAVDTLLPQVVCARSPQAQPDGSLRGALVTRSDADVFAERDAFPTSGRWACVARALGMQDIHTAWSAPVSLTVHGLFDIVDTRATHPSAPNFAVRLSTGDPNAAGGRVTLPLRSCRRGTQGKRVRRVTLRARVDRRGNATLRFRLPERRGEFPTHYVGRPRFSGTRLVGRGMAAGVLSFYDVHDLFEGHIVAVQPGRRC